MTFNLAGKSQVKSWQGSRLRSGLLDMDGTPVASAGQLSPGGPIGGYNHLRSPVPAAAAEKPALPPPTPPRKKVGRLQGGDDMTWADALYLSGAALRDIANPQGDAMGAAQALFEHQRQQYQIEHDRQARAKAFQASMGPNGFDIDAYYKALVAGGLPPALEDLEQIERMQRPPSPAYEMIPDAPRYDEPAPDVFDASYGDHPTWTRQFGDIQRRMLRGLG